MIMHADGVHVKKQHYSQAHEGTPQSIFKYLQTSQPLDFNSVLPLDFISVIPETT